VRIFFHVESRAIGRPIRGEHVTSHIRLRAFANEEGRIERSTNGLQMCDRQTSCPSMITLNAKLNAQKSTRIREMARSMLHPGIPIFRHSRQRS
jgi:hypothetical protein